MAVRRDRKRPFEQEGLALRALCQGTLPGTTWKDCVRLLSGYAWRDPEHQVVFEVLSEIGSDDPQTRREELPSRMTRKGFPELDLETYFEPLQLTAKQACDLIRALAGSRRAAAF